MCLSERAKIMFYFIQLSGNYRPRLRNIQPTESHLWVGSLPWPIVGTLHTHSPSLYWLVEQCRQSSPSSQRWWRLPENRAYIQTYVLVVLSCGSLRSAMIGWAPTYSLPCLGQLDPMTIIKEIVEKCASCLSRLSRPLAQTFTFISMF